MAVTKTYFTVRQINILRGRAQRAAAMPEPVVEGWSKCTADPMRLLAAFKSLRVREGYVLRAYQYFTGGNGNSVVCALPVAADFPEPDNCRGERADLFDPPRPLLALERMMQGIDGDGTPRSYLSASIFLRELTELGALWHGCDWSTRSIVGTDPTLDDPDHWEWSESGQPIGVLVSSCHRRARVSPSIVLARSADGPSTAASIRTAVATTTSAANQPSSPTAAAVLSTELWCQSSEPCAPGIRSTRWATSTTNKRQ